MINVKRQVFLSVGRANVPLRRPIHCRGQTLVEYALILAVISIVAISVMINLSTSISSIYTMVNSQVIIAAAASH